MKPITYINTILHLRPSAKVALVGGLGYENIQWGDEAPIPQSDLDAALPFAQAAQVAATRRKEIISRLSAIDLESIRAIRAKTVGNGKPHDDTKLTDLDTEAETLRAELAQL